MKADETLPEQPGDGGKMEQSDIKRSCFLDLFGGILYKCSYQVAIPRVGF